MVYWTGVDAARHPAEALPCNLIFTLVWVWPHTAPSPGLYPLSPDPRLADTDP